MNQGGRESQKNTAVGQMQYPDEAVGTRNTCKTKEREKKNNQRERRAKKGLPMADNEKYGRIHQDACNHVIVF